LLHIENKVRVKGVWEKKMEAQKEIRGGTERTTVRLNWLLGEGAGLMNIQANVAGCG